MSDALEFLREAAARAALTPDELLARILHVDDGSLSPLLDAMNEETRNLTLHLDREVRLRNPGVQYVVRGKFVGYRREGPTPSACGERSQIFLSVLRNNSRLDVVVPVDPDQFSGLTNAEDLRGKGHHGIGDLRITLASDADIAQFLTDLDHLLSPN